MNAFLDPSAWLFDFLKTHESFRPTAYKPLKGDRWTIGYGHTAGVKQGDVCSHPQADAWLRSDVMEAAYVVNQHVTVPLGQHQFDALCSLVFNIGAVEFEESHLLVLLNDGHYSQAADEFLRWDHSGGKVIAGLLERRRAERAAFLA